jgi:hypothetical protein
MPPAMVNRLTKPTTAVRNAALIFSPPDHLLVRWIVRRDHGHLKRKFHRQGCHPELRIGERPRASILLMLSSSQRE